MGRPVKADEACRRLPQAAPESWGKDIMGERQRGSDTGMIGVVTETW
jgi:hypothetical protein